MIKRIKSGRIITEGGLVDGYVYYDTESGRITHVGDGAPAFDAELDVGADYVSPGLIDLHTHGAAGYDYGEVTSPEQAEAALSYQVRHGATAVFATLTSASDSSLMDALGVMRQVSERGIARNFAGAHVEGPFFSPEAAGAQNPKYLSDPRPELYEGAVKKYGDIIKRWDYAPERDKDGAFAAYLTEHGILPSAAHSAGTIGDVRVAMSKGMRLLTHLYSAMSTITRHGGFRVAGLIECAYIFDELYAELICDGCHLPEDILRMIFKTKSHDRLILVTDSLKVAGTDALEGALSGIEFVIEDGVCKLKDRSAFAGSIATADRLIRVATTLGGLSMVDAVNMMSKNPAELFSLNKGRLAPGLDADIIVFDDEVRISHVIIGGAEQ